MIDERRPSSRRISDGDPLTIGQILTEAPHHVARGTRLWILRRIEVGGKLVEFDNPLPARLRINTRRLRLNPCQRGLSPNCEVHRVGRQIVRILRRLCLARKQTRYDAVDGGPSTVGLDQTINCGALKLTGICILEVMFTEDEIVLCVNEAFHSPRQDVGEIADCNRRLQGSILKNALAQAASDVLWILPIVLGCSIDSSDESGPSARSHHLRGRLGWQYR